MRVDKGDGLLMTLQQHVVNGLATRKRDGHSFRSDDRRCGMSSGTKDDRGGEENWRVDQGNRQWVRCHRTHGCSGSVCVVLLHGLHVLHEFFMGYFSELSRR